jgi:hypothetical protein
VPLGCSLFHTLILEAEMLARIVKLAIVALAMSAGDHVNAAPVTYGTYYDETVSTNCPASSSCRVNFSQLPADKLLMVNQISCQIGSNSVALAAVGLFISATSGGIPLQRNYNLSYLASSLIGGSYFTNVQQNIHYLVGQGRFPSIFASYTAPTNTSASCTLVGDLVTPIQ